MTQGVWPPLTANTNDPRAAIASHAQSAIMAAALCATDPGSGNTSMFIACPPLRSDGKMLLLEASFHEFDIQSDIYLFAHEDAAGFEGCVPHETKILAVDLG